MVVQMERRRRLADRLRKIAAEEEAKGRKEFAAGSYGAREKWKPHRCPRRLIADGGTVEAQHGRFI